MRIWTGGVFQERKLIKQSIYFCPDGTHTHWLPAVQVSAVIGLQSENTAVFSQRLQAIIVIC